MTISFNQGKGAKGSPQDIVVPESQQVFQENVVAPPSGVGSLSDRGYKSPVMMAVAYAIRGAVRTMN